MSLLETMSQLMLAMGAILSATMDLLSLIFPHSCVGCGKLGLFICQECYEEVEFIKLPVRLKLEPLYLTKVWSAAKLRPPISSLIYQLKYQNVKDIGVYGGKLLYITQTLPPVDVVMTIPLSRRRLSERGFNQSEVIARSLAEPLKVPYRNWLRKTRDTLTQASVHDRSKRLTNLDDVFGLTPTINLTEINGKSILLIDDVLTTGTTLNQAAKVLKGAGAREVFGLTLAHGS